MCWTGLAIHKISCDAGLYETKRTVHTLAQNSGLCRRRRLFRHTTSVVSRVRPLQGTITVANGDDSHDSFTNKNSVFLSRKLCSVSGYVLPLTCRNRQIWPTSLYYDRPIIIIALDPAAGYHTGYQRQQIGLFQASAEDVPVSMSGRLVAADGTSEEQF